MLNQHLYPNEDIELYVDEAIMEGAGLKMDNWTVK